MIVDINTSVGHWPFQALDADTPARLAAVLSRAGISKALVSPMDAVLLPTPDRENERLFRLLRGRGPLIPVPVVNPLLPQWRDTVREYAARTPVVKVYPNYHGYPLSDGRMNELMRDLSRKKLALILPLRIEDERSHHPLMKVLAVPTNDILSLARAFPRVTIACCCPYRQEAATLLKGPPNVYVDISMIDGFDAVQTIVTEDSSKRVLFGSHAPFLYAQSAVLKVSELDISETDRRQVLWENVRRAFRLSAACLHKRAP